MKEKNRHILKKAIGDMPTFKAQGLNFWEIFDNGQNIEPITRFGNPISDLPQKIAPEGLWESIEARLVKGSKTRQLRSANYLARVAAAAVIILLIGSGLFFLKHQYTKESFPQRSEIKKIITDRNDDIDFESIWNPTLCESNPKICNTVFFKELDKQLMDVKGELNLMEPVIQNGDPQMMKYYYRLVNLKVEIEKKMIKIIMES